MLGMVVLRKGNRLVLKHCEGLVVLELKSLSTVQPGELINGTMNCKGEADLSRTDSGEAMQVVILEPDCCVEKVRLYLN